ncbi:MAG: hypothetical protein WBM41_15690 [Arenicellales bacterium]
MTRRTKADWRALIVQQQTSGLSAAEFCRRHEINAKYFSLRKKQLSDTDTNSSFVQIAPKIGVPAYSSSSGIKLRVIEVELPLQESRCQSDTLPLLLDRLLK